MSLFDLTGKVAVVTGASRGIGRAIAQRMAEHGARVVVSSRKLEACEAVVQKIRSSGGQALAVTCNIGHKNELQGWSIPPWSNGARSTSWSATPP